MLLMIMCYMVLSFPLVCLYPIDCLMNFNWSSSRVWVIPWRGCYSALCFWTHGKQSTLTCFWLHCCLGSIGCHILTFFGWGSWLKWLGLIWFISMIQVKESLVAFISIIWARLLDENEFNLCSPMSQLRFTYASLNTPETSIFLAIMNEAFFLLLSSLVCSLHLNVSFVAGSPDLARSLIS